MPTISKLTAAIGCDSNELTSGLDAAAGKFLNFKNLLGGINLPMAALGAAVTGVAVESLKAGAEFQEAFGNIAAATGATGDALDKLTGQFSTNYLAITQGSNEASAAFGRLKQRTDLQGEAFDHLFVKESQLARVTKQDLTQTIDDTTRAMAKWGITSAEMSGHLDRLLVVSQQTGVTVSNLSNYLKVMGAPLQDMGLSFDRAAEMLGRWDRAGLNVTQTTFGLRHAMSAMVEEGIKPSAANMEYLIGVIEKNKNTALGAAEANRLFGKRAGEELIDAMKRGVFSVTDFTRALTDAHGAIKKTDDAVNPLQKSIDQMKHAWTEAIVPTKEEVQVLTDFVVKATEVISWIGKMNHAFSDWIETQISGSERLVAQHDKQLKAEEDAKKKQVAVFDPKDITDIQQKWEKAGEAAGKGAADGIDKVAPHVQSELDKLLSPKPKKHKLDEHDKEFAEFKKMKEGALKELDELESGGSAATAKLLGHFHALSTGTVISLADIRAHIDQLILKQKEMGKVGSAMDEAKAKVIELKNELEFGKEGMFSVEALRKVFHDLVPEKMLEGLSKTLNLEKDLTKQVEEHRKAEEKAQALNKEGARKLADVQAEYLRLTKTRQEDQIALELYGKTFDQLTDDQHIKTAQQITFWMKTVEAEKELIQTNKEMENSEKSLGKAIAEMQMKLQLKSAVEEEDRAVKELLTTYDKLPPALKGIERELEAQARFGDKATWAGLNEQQQKEIDLVLDLTHALAIKSKQEKDDAAALKETGKITEELTLHLNEQIEKEQELLGIHKQKMSAFTQKMEMLRAENKLTADQIKLLDEIEAHETIEPAIEKHVKLMKQLTDTMKSEFTKVFEDLATGQKGVFKSIEDDFSKMLSKMAAEYLASRLSQLFTQLVGGLVGGGTSVPGKAVGGPMAPGELAMVGEHGPEFFRANQAGTIIPTGQSSGGGTTVNASVTVYAQDANSFRYSQQQIAHQLGSAIQRSLQRNG